MMNLPTMELDGGYKKTKKREKLKKLRKIGKLRKQEQKKCQKDLGKVRKNLKRDN